MALIESYIALDDAPPAFSDHVPDDLEPSDLVRSSIVLSVAAHGRVFYG